MCFMLILSKTVGSLEVPKVETVTCQSTLPLNEKACFGRSSGVMVTWLYPLFKSSV